MSLEITKMAWFGRNENDCTITGFYFKTLTQRVAYGMHLKNARSLVYIKKS